MLKMFLLFLAYAIAPIVAGHGMLPMAWLLFDAPTWRLALAWGAIFVVVAALSFLRGGSPAQLVAQIAGTLGLYGAWLSNVLYINQFNAQAEQWMAIESMFVFSIPFQVTAVVVVCLLATQLKRALSKPQDASP